MSPRSAVLDRPLAVAVPRRVDGELVFELGSLEYRFQGDIELIEAVLPHCDGTRDSAAISARCGHPLGGVEECVDMLATQGLVVPAEEAYRHLHRLSAVDSPLQWPRSEAEVAELMRTPRWRPTKIGETVELAYDASRGDRESANVPLCPPTFEQISSILLAAYGMGANGHSVVPSAGALYPLVIHVLLSHGAGEAAPGLWWFDWEAAQLAELTAGPVDAGDIFLSDPLLDRLLSDGPAIILISADIGRAARKYGPRAYRYVLMEVGAAMQGAYACAAELGLGVRAIGGIDERAVERRLALPDDVLPLLALIIGLPR